MKMRKHAVWGRLLALVLLGMVLLNGAVALSHLYQEGDQGLEIEKINERLMELGYLTATPGKVYTQDTTHAVLQFQARNGLLETGMVDEITWQALFNESALAYADYEEETVWAYDAAYRAMPSASYFASESASAMNYVSNVGGLDDVGLYSAGTAIVTNYIGLVFAAVATDYFPRLAATNSNEEMGLAVNTQAELTILLLAPLVVAFLVFIKPVIILLYSDKFLPIENMMYWAIGAVLLQAMGWALSYTLLAKAKPSYFFLNELVTTAWGLPIKLLCYKYWGLTGFGMATMICYALYLVQVLIVTRKLFGIRYGLSQWRLFLLLYIPILIAVAIKVFLPENWSYIAGTLVLLLTGTCSLFILNKKMDLKALVNGKLKRKRQ
mgnify:CR=1 FL=1